MRWAITHGSLSLCLEWAASSLSPNSRDAFRFQMVTKRNESPKRSTFPLLVSFPEFFSLAQFITYRCKHLSGNTSELSMGSRCWWLVRLISEKCTEQSRMRRQPVAGRVSHWAKCSRAPAHTSVLEVALEDWQAGRSSNQEKSLKSPKAKPDCQGHFSRCLFITPEEPSWAFQPCSASNTLPRVCNYEGSGGSGKRSVLPTHASSQEEDKPAEIHRIPPPSRGAGLAPPGPPSFTCETRIIPILSFLNVVKIKLH